MAVGSQEAQQQQQGQRGGARGDGHVPHFGAPSALLLPPLQVAELAALPHVARHTTAKETQHMLQWVVGQSHRPPLQPPCAFIHHWAPLQKHLVEFSSGDDKIIVKEYCWKLQNPVLKVFFFFFPPFFLCTVIFLLLLNCLYNYTGRLSLPDSYGQKAEEKNFLNPINPAAWLVFPRIFHLTSFSSKLPFL